MTLVRFFSLIWQGAPAPTGRTNFNQIDEVDLINLSDEAINSLIEIGFLVSDHIENATDAARDAKLIIESDYERRALIPSKKAGQSST